MDRPKNIQGLIDGLTEKNRQLALKNDEIKELAEKKAATDRDYSIAYAKEVMNLKLEKEPATIIPTLAKGDILVADLRYKADIADAVYRASIEKMKDIRINIDSYRSILAFEKAEMFNQE